MKEKYEKEMIDKMRENVLNYLVCFLKVLSFRPSNDNFLLKVTIRTSNGRTGHRGSYVLVQKPA